MHKLLIFITFTASLLLGGCSSSGGGDWITNSLDKLPLIYRPHVQQGNVVTQDMVNRLETNMTKRQVQFVLGTPMLVDVFHKDRWDFVYTAGDGSRPDEMKRVSLFFDNDQLSRITGELRPQAVSETEAEKKEVVVSVPDWEGDQGSLWRRFLRLVGADDNDV